MLNQTTEYPLQISLHKIFSLEKENQHSLLEIEIILSRRAINSYLGNFSLQQDENFVFKYRESIKKRMKVDRLFVWRKPKLTKVESFSQFEIFCKAQLKIQIKWRD